MSDCIFCSLPESAKILQNDLAYAIYDVYPQVKGHSLVILNRHVDSFFDITDEELIAAKDLLTKQKDNLLKDDPSIKAFNVRVNVGKHAGQSVMHVHFHLLPRRENDKFHCPADGKTDEDK
jgi:diadenosine tetraphosphate (Ap4A) HIT family hydrolase